MVVFIEKTIIVLIFEIDGGSIHIAIVLINQNTIILPYIFIFECKI